MSKKRINSNVLFLTALSSAIGTAATSSCTFANEDIPTFKSLGYANLDNNMVKEQEARLGSMGLINLPFNVKDFDVFAKKEIKKLNDSRSFLKKLSYIYAENSLSKDTANKILTNYYNQEILPKTIKSIKDDCYNNGLRQGIERGKQLAKDGAKNNLFSSTPAIKEDNDQEFIKNESLEMSQIDTVKKVAIFSFISIVAYKIYDFLFGSNKSQQQKKHSKEKYHGFYGKNKTIKKDKGEDDLDLDD